MVIKLSCEKAISAEVTGRTVIEGDRVMDGWCEAQIECKIAC